MKLAVFGGDSPAAEHTMSAVDPPVSLNQMESPGAACWGLRAGSATRSRAV